MGRTPAEVGRIVRARRRSRGLTQESVPGISSALVGRIERGTASDGDNTTTQRIAFMRALHWPDDALDQLAAGGDPLVLPDTIHYRSAEPYGDAMLQVESAAAAYESAMLRLMHAERSGLGDLVEAEAAFRVAALQAAAALSAEVSADTIFDDVGDHPALQPGAGLNDDDVRSWEEDVRRNLSIVAAARDVLDSIEAHQLRLRAAARGDDSGRQVVELSMAARSGKPSKTTGRVGRRPLSAPEDQPPD